METVRSGERHPVRGRIPFQEAGLLLLVAPALLLAQGPSPGPPTRQDRTLPSGLPGGAPLPPARTYPTPPARSSFRNIDAIFQRMDHAMQRMDRFFEHRFDQDPFFRDLDRLLDRPSLLPGLEPGGGPSSLRAPWKRPPASAPGSPGPGGTGTGAGLGAHLPGFEMPSVELSEQGDRFVVEVRFLDGEEPRVKVRVEDDGRLLRLAGTREVRRSREDRDGSGVRLHEGRSLGSWEQTLRLPAAVDPSGLDMQALEGRVRIVLPRAAPRSSAGPTR